MAPDLTSIPSGAVTRFAPSPTGMLHLGHVANAVWTWGVAQATGGRVVVRLEDHDRGRCKAEYDSAILADLDWLGLLARATAESVMARPSPFRQSDNPGRYQAALERMASLAPVYACTCSRKQIQAVVGELATGEELRYPGTCRRRGSAIGPGRGIRVVMPEIIIGFDDLRLGHQTQQPSQQCGDLLLKDSTGNWTYQFSVVVDDMADGIDLVIRGEDLIDSTGRQIVVGNLLGRATPARYLHHPLMLADNGAKLSKRDGAPGLDELRARGESPEEVLGRAAYATGLIDPARPVAANELGSLFVGA